MALTPHWFQQLRQEWVIPEVIPERCVHSQCEVATCTACVDSCPREAWILDDASLQIDTTRCDGCGLCVGACPESALDLEFKPAKSILEEKSTLLLACEVIAGGKTGAGVVPCLHSLDTPFFLRYWQEGYTQLISTRDDCQQCPRFLGADRFREQLARLNALLVSRHAHPLRHATVAWATWQHYLQKQSQSVVATPQPTPATVEGEEPVARRQFFRKAITLATEASLNQLAALNTPKPDLTPWPSTLPTVAEEAGDVVPLQAYVPQLDPQRCNGCNACVQLCPHQALLLSKEETSGLAQAYVIRASYCTGCGICVDACDQAAVTLQTMQPVAQTELALQTGQCKACGVGFHKPAVQNQQAYCRICAQTNHHRNLFQVYTD